MTKDNQVSEDYAQKITDSIHDGSFFKDSMQWYIFQYIRPTIDRNLMILFSLIGAICIFYLYQMIHDSFPLVEEVPVIIREHDTSLLRPVIKKLKDPSDRSSAGADQYMLKYLLTNYVTDREAFDFRNSDVKNINQKFSRIKNNSSYLEYRNFQSQMSKENPASPINFFGQNIYKTVEVSSLKFIPKEVAGGIASSISSYFHPQLSSSAEIGFKATINSIDGGGKKVAKSKKYLVKISFDFAGLDRESKSGRLGFAVKEYNLFEVK